MKIFKRILNKLFKPLIVRVSTWLILGTSAFYFLYTLFPINPSKITDSDFLFQFLGILLGFALTIFQFIISLVDKIREKKEMEYKTDPKKLELLQLKIQELYTEIKDDIIFIFTGLILTTILFFATPVTDSVTEEITSKALKTAIFFLNLYAIYDLIIVSFRVSDTTAIFRLDKSNGKN